MKRFVAAALVAASALTLVACGNAEKEKAMQDQIDSCTKDKQVSDAKVTELQAKVDDLTKQLADAKPAATPEATTAMKGKTPAKTTVKATPKPVATAAAAAATPKPGPTKAPTKVLKGLKGGKLH